MDSVKLVDCLVNDKLDQKSLEELHSRARIVTGFSRG
jgi:hypothetical protein